MTFRFASLSVVSGGPIIHLFRVKTNSKSIELRDQVRTEHLFGQRLEAKVRLLFIRAPSIRVPSTRAPFIQTSAIDPSNYPDYNLELWMPRYLLAEVSTCIGV